MEVVGAVASFIAIGEAVAKLPKIVGFFRSLPEIQNEAASLANELETLRITHHQLKQAAQLFRDTGKPGVVSSDGLAPALDPSLLDRASHDLNDIVAGVERFCSECCANADGKEAQLKVKRLKWLWKKHRLDELHRRTGQIRNELQTALAILSFDRQTRLLLEIKHISLSSATGIGRVQAQIDALSHEDTATTDTRSSPTLRADVDPKSLSGQGRHKAPGAENKTPADIFKADPRGLTDSADFGDDKFVRLQASLVNFCLRDCRCHCHLRRKRTVIGSSWLTPVLGSLLFSHNALPLWDVARCSEPTCRRSGSSVQLSYTFPAWLCGRTLSVAASLQSLAGLGSTLHFSTTRVFPIGGDGLYRYAQVATAVQFRELMLSKRMYYPGDTDEAGESMLETTIYWGNNDLLAFLLRLWEPILRHQGCDNKVIAAAQWILWQGAHPDPLPPETTYLLGKVITLDRDPTLYVDSAIHRAVLADGEAEDALSTALKDEPWAIDSPGAVGQAPLHLAAKRNKARIIRQLLRGGANINQPNRWNQTSCMVALDWGNTECARTLIEAGCNLECTDIYGRTVIQSALTSPGPAATDVIELSLRRRPSLVNQRLRYGSTNLHELAKFSSSLASTDVEERLSLLLAAGCNIEARDQWGYTPLMCAVRRNNVQCTRFLIHAGATLSYEPLPPYKCNILHHAAMYCNDEMLRFLREQHISSVDPESSDSCGVGTPWDYFLMGLGMYGMRQTIEREPTYEIMVEFVQLYREVRDRYLQSEIQDLQAILGAVQNQRAQEASELLGSIYQRKEAENKDADATTFRTIRLQVAEQMWEAAVEAVEEVIDVRYERMATHPWEQRSPCDPRGEVSRLIGVLMEAHDPKRSKDDSSSPNASDDESSESPDSEPGDGDSTNDKGEAADSASSSR